MPSGPDQAGDGRAAVSGSPRCEHHRVGVELAVCQDSFCAILARSHSDTNVVCIGGKIIGSALARAWMRTEFLGGDEKYQRRVGKVREISERHLKRLPPA